MYTIGAMTLYKCISHAAMGLMQPRLHHGGAMLTLQPKMDIFHLPGSLLVEIFNVVYYLNLKI